MFYDLEIRCDFEVNLYSMDYYSIIVCSFIINFEFV